MNFKQEYEKAFTDIKADENFKKNLVAMMDAESKKTKKKKTSAYIGGFAAAAVMVLVIGVGFATGILRGKMTQEPITDGADMVQDDVESVDDVEIDLGNNIVAEQQMSDGYVEFNFSDLSWYGKAESDEELLDIFKTLMCGDALEMLYCTDKEQFDEASLMSANDTSVLLERVQAAVCTNAEFAGDSHYYKAVFEDGLTIKFWVSDEGYLKLQDTGAVYQIP